VITIADPRDQDEAIEVFTMAEIRTRPHQRPRARPLA